MLNAVKNGLAITFPALCTSHLIHQSNDEGLTLETSTNTLYGVQHIYINLTLIHSMVHRYAHAANTSSPD